MKQNGSNLRVYRNGTMIAYERDFTFTIDNNLPDASNKDSGGFAEHIRGQKSATLDFTALVDLTADYGMPEALNELIDRGEITVSWQLVDSATEFYAGRASYSTISSDASNEDVVLWSGSLTINGDFGIYPVSITRELRVDNNNTGFQGSQIFGYDASNSFYYMDNTTGEQIRLKNTIETTITSGYTASDFVGYDSNGNNAYTALQTSPTFLKMFNGIETGFAYSDLVSVNCFCVDGDYLYYTYISGGNVFLKKINWKTGVSSYNVDTGYAEADNQIFQIVKQSTHIVFSHYDAASTTIWYLDVHNESTGAFIRTISVVNDADTIGVWLAVLGTNLYASYGDGTNTYLKKLTFNNTTLTTLVTSGSPTIAPIRVFNNKIYVKLVSGGNINIYNSSDVNIGEVETSIASITDFAINNGVLIAYSSGTTSIKCFPV